MSPELTTGLIAVITALVTALGIFLARSRLSDVIASGSVREQTAVNQIANLLEKTADRDEKTLARLLDMLDKALDTVAKQTGAMQQIALTLQGHERDSSLRWSQDVETSKRVISTVDEMRDTIDGLEKFITDLALKILQDRHIDPSTGSGQSLAKAVGHGD